MKGYDAVTVTFRIPLASALVQLELTVRLADARKGAGLAETVLDCRAELEGTAEQLPVISAATATETRRDALATATRSESIVISYRLTSSAPNTSRHRHKPTIANSTITPPRLPRGGTRAQVMRYEP